MNRQRHIRIAGLIAFTATFLITTIAGAAPRDVQFRSIDFETNIVELFNFGDTSQSMSGWRFCTHDENQIRKYSSPDGLNGVSLGAGESLFVYFDNDAPAATNAKNISSLGGDFNFATPLDRGPYGMQIYVNSSFPLGSAIADHVQWSVGGVDNRTADERSDEAQFGGVWTNQSKWVVTSPDTRRIELNDFAGGVLHGPGDYTAIDTVGDTDGDGDVDAADLNSLFVNWGTGTLALQGNVDGKGTVDAADLATMLANWTPPGDASSGSPQAVPEPSTLLLALLAALGILNTRFRRRTA